MVDLVVCLAMANPKPLVQAACVCENALVEPDNTVSLIRVVDTFTANLNVPEGLKAAITLNIVVMLKSGDVRGSHELAIHLHQPNKKHQELKRWTALFEGNESGSNMKMQFNLITPKEGLYWFDVLWGEEVLTRIPFRLKQAAPQEPSAP
jgi:hypothetical protein